MQSSLKAVTLLLLSISFVFAQDDPCSHTQGYSGGTQVQGSSIRQDIGNGKHVELWYDGSRGGGSMTYFGGDADCAFKASWNNCGDYLARVGYYWGGGNGKTYKDLGGDIKAEYNYKGKKMGDGGGGYSYIGIYGWTNQPQIEYYIVDDSFTPGGGGMMWGAQRKASYEMDGATYTLYIGQRNNAPSITGTSTFQQVFAVRSEFRECGSLSVSDHFKEWEKNGVHLGGLYDCKLLAEVGGGSGSIEYTWARMNIE